MVVLSTSETLGLECVPEDIRQGRSALLTGESQPQAVAGGSLNDVEREMIRRTLIDVGGNKSLASKKLGISRRTLYRKIEEYQL